MSENESSEIDDELAIRFDFKHEFSREMRLCKDFRRRVKELYRLAYVGSYESFGGGSEGKKLSWCGIKVLEKRAAMIVHEFLSWTVAKMVEMEWISLFRKWFGIDLNIWDLFLDHLGIFYLSTKGNRHMIFLLEAYERGCLIEPNPVYAVKWSARLSSWQKNTRNEVFICRNRMSDVSNSRRNVPANQRTPRQHRKPFITFQWPLICLDIRVRTNSQFFGRLLHDSPSHVGATWRSSIRPA
ncbi:hypothetical protein Syun_009075 [Stephania yunnanensis]|uniref:PORR domain-containing protein n=1 Tax=Stephania yunnanensis TaxID=152371 RepID=A0AAP0KDS5_9MAGN